MNTLNLCISLIFVFLIFSIVVSGVQEWWAQLRGMRGRWLRLGLTRLIGDDELLKRVMAHPLVDGLRKQTAKLPSYIEPTNFALALAAAMRQAAQQPAATTAELTFTSLRNAAVALAAKNSPTADAVLPILDKANGNLAVALKGIEAWFTSGMDRVTGWYKAAAQRRLFAIGFAVALLGNVDTIAIYHALDRSPALASQLADSAAAVAREGKLGPLTTEQLQRGEFTAEQARDVLKLALSHRTDTLPLGYDCLSAAADATTIRPVCERCFAELRTRWANGSLSDALARLLGLILTALAATLGAPYWFSLLSKVVGIRGSGPKPPQKTP